MASFRISAPGKVILFGEHAVVYGKTAVAASLNLRSRLHLQELPASDEPRIHLELPSLSLSQEIPLLPVRNCLLSPSFPSLRADGHEEFHRRIRDFVEASFDLAEPRQRASLECFFYALLQVAQADGLELRGFRLELDSELSIGAGAGSSASFAVCLVAGFLRWAQLQRDPRLPAEFDAASLERISRYALNCEKIMHGSPSGIDNSVCTFGSVIEFRKGEAPVFVPLGSRSLRVLLVDTKVGRSTKLLVERVAGLRLKFPDVFRGVLGAIDGVSRQALGIVRRMQAADEDEIVQLLEAYKDLAVLIDINQGLLATCQVSHSSLDLICTTAKQFGFSAKLTGAGGGGFAYVLIPPDAASDSVQDLSSELIKNGFSVTETSLGGTGVEIHDAGYTLK